MDVYELVFDLLQARKVQIKTVHKGLRCCFRKKAENKLKHVLEEVGKDKLLFPARFIASIVGQLISMQIVIGDTVRLNTRYLYDCILSRAAGMLL